MGLGLSPSFVPQGGRVFTLPRGENMRGEYTPQRRSRPGGPHSWGREEAPFINAPIERPPGGISKGGPPPPYFGERENTLGDDHPPMISCRENTS